ncbi:hypothetical protein [Blastococcus saxobsidens]|uniref:Uncharacterized protein n=1 Tax=Blastococcus saxobsidens TaxID=138336 RepID=A0A4Q7Y937_9ACTN|nr:hypothetical protein [Blastococcus saxobsidens]RZU33034.1 hypothetical protein BKA19_2749 [Blastococcus saxobsidens]
MTTTARRSGVASPPALPLGVFGVLAALGGLARPLAEPAGAIGYGLTSASRRRSAR